MTQEKQASPLITPKIGGSPRKGTQLSSITIKPAEAPKRISEMSAEDQPIQGNYTVVHNPRYISRADPPRLI